MAQTLQELVYVGFPGRVASALAFTGTMSITAAGTVQGDATLLTTSLNIITNAAANTGVRLPPTRNPVSGEPAHFIIIRNSGANSVNIWPAVGDSINNGAVDAASSIAASSGRILYTLGDGVWVG